MAERQQVSNISNNLYSDTDIDYYLKYSNKIFKTLHTNFWKFFFTTNLNAIRVFYIYKHTEMYLTEDNTFPRSSKDIETVLLMS